MSGECVGAVHRVSVLVGRATVAREYGTLVPGGRVSTVKVFNSITAF